MVSTALLALIKANKNKFARSAGKAHKFKEGRTRVRILPYQDPEAEFHQPLALHWIKPSEDAKPIAVVGDVEYTVPNDGKLSEITPLIEKAVAGAKAAGDEESFKLYKSWFARKSVLVNAIIRDTADASENPKIVEMGPSLFSDIMGAIELYAADEVPVFALDLKDGFDFIVERKGKGLDTEYTVMKAPSSKPVNKAVMDKTYDLRAYVEKEHFRGEDAKAIAAIERLSGVTASAALVRPRGTALLTSRAAAVTEEPDLAEVIEAEVIAPKAAPNAAAAKPAATKSAAKAVEAPPTAPAASDEAFGAELNPKDLDGMLSELDGLLA